MSSRAGRASLCDRHPVSYRGCYQHTRPVADPDPTSNRHGDPFTYSHGSADGDSRSFPNTYCHCNPCSTADTHPHDSAPAHTQTVFTCPSAHTDSSATAGAAACGWRRWRRRELIDSDAGADTNTRSNFGTNADADPELGSG